MTRPESDLCSVSVAHLMETLGSTAPIDVAILEARGTEENLSGLVLREKEEADKRDDLLGALRNILQRADEVSNSSGSGEAKDWNEAEARESESTDSDQGTSGGDKSDRSTPSSSAETASYRIVDQKTSAKRCLWPGPDEDEQLACLGQSASTQVSKGTVLSSIPP